MAGVHLYLATIASFPTSLLPMAWRGHFANCTDNPRIVMNPPFSAIQAAENCSWTDGQCVCRRRIPR